MVVEVVLVLAVVGDQAAGLLAIEVELALNSGHVVQHGLLLHILCFFVRLAFDTITIAFNCRLGGIHLLHYSLLWHLETLVYEFDLL